MLYYRPPPAFNPALLRAIADARCSATLSRYMAVTAARSAPPASPLPLAPPTPLGSGPLPPAADDKEADAALTRGSSSYIQSSSAISAAKVTRSVSRACCRRRTLLPSLQWTWSFSSWSWATRTAAASATDWAELSASEPPERLPPAAEDGGL